MAYVPNFVPQKDGSKYQYQNCTMASGAMLLDKQTIGQEQVSGGEMRLRSGDRVGGTGLSDVRVAFATFAQPLDILTGGTFDDMLDFLDHDYGVILQGDYDQLTLNVRCQDNFLDDHAIYMQTAQYGDPLCKNFTALPPMGQLRNYAEKLGRKYFGYKASGQPIFFAVSRQALPDTSTEGPMSIPVGNTGDYRVELTVGDQLYDEDFKTAQKVSTKQTAHGMFYTGTGYVAIRYAGVLRFAKSSNVTVTPVATDDTSDYAARLANVKQKTAAFNKDIQDD